MYSCTSKCTRSPPSLMLHSESGLSQVVSLSGISFHGHLTGTVTSPLRHQVIYLSSSFPSVRGEVLPATFSPPHLIVFFTLLCLLSSSSSLPLLLSSSHISPPISALASLVSSCPPHVTLPLSSVVCHPPSFLRVQPTVICSSPVSMSSSSALQSLPQ